MSNLQPNCCLEFDFRKVDQHEKIYIYIYELVIHLRIMKSVAYW